MTQMYRMTEVDVLLQWILLIVNDNYYLKKHDGRIWLYNSNGIAKQYIDDPSKE